MAKLTLNDLANLESETTAVQSINANNAAIEAAFENTLSRDGTSPNTMLANLDMNSKRILNLPAPTSNTEPLRLADVGGILPSDIANAGQYAADAQAAAEAAAASAAAAASYVGAATQAPKWSTPRTITLSGDVSGTSPAWDGSTNLTWSGLTIPNSTVTAAKLAPNAALGNLGYTPANLAGATFTGEVRLNWTPLAVLNADSAGFRGIPVKTIDTGYEVILDDCGKMLRHTSGTAHGYGILNTSTVNYPEGFTFVVRNVGTGLLSITKAAGVTFRKVGSAADANFTIAQWGMATCIHEGSNVWVISGTGIS